MKITDIHIHGFGGYDTRTNNYEHILAIADLQGASGISEIMLTIYPSAIPEMRRQMETVKKAMEIQQTQVHSHEANFTHHIPFSHSHPPKSFHGWHRPAVIAGIHLEGPFLNPVRRGSLSAEACIRPSEHAFKDLIAGFEDIIKVITISPEIPYALTLIKQISDMGIAVSMGHSDATYAEAEKGFHAGAKGITHLFNAMRGFHHREPGIAGFGLSHRDVYVEIIADPFHLHGLVIDLIFRLKPPDKIIIVSDAVQETGEEIHNSGIRDSHGVLRGGSMAITQSAERLIGQGYDSDTIMKCITENPQRYLS